MMKAAMSTSGTNQALKQSQNFITRWTAGDKTCMPTDAGALVTVPYPGLRSFRPELNQFFFGRERQKSELKAFFSDETPRVGDRRRRVTFVVGGSGSGKSSLTLAGLVAELNTVTMPEMSGAWYVAETRPEKDPIEQLLLALNRIVASNIDLAVRKIRKTGSDDQVGDRVLAIARALGCTETRNPEELKKDFASWLGKRLASVQPGSARPTLDTLQLFRFVDVTLDQLDAEMGSASQRSGKPSLLIHIDQFEEVFREETDANGREALMQLLRSVHEYGPPRLFVVATMRSEELHKCSEYEGIAEVVNSSMYLVDLVSQEEIQRAIVEPARRQATLWELPTSFSATSPYTPEAVRLLQRAYYEAGTAVQHTADQLPLLQHLLPLLWEAAVDDWILRRSTDVTAKLEITREILERIQGWIDTDNRQREPIAKTKIAEWILSIISPLSQSKNSRLGRCLNAHADAVLEAAINKWREVDVKPSDSRALAVFRSSPPDTGFGETSPERAGLIAAFCCLAQLDDRGRAARRFVTLDEIVAASGLMQWNDRQYTPDRIRRCLEQALGEFERAGFIERIGLSKSIRYNVNHEAFIRNWGSYEAWLNEMRFVQQRLCEADPQATRLSRRPPSWNPIDWILANRKRDAYAIIPDETGNRLRCVFGDTPIFSRAWVEDILAASDKASKPEAELSNAKISVAERFKAIKSVWEDAGWWQENGWTRQTTAAILAASLVGALGLLVYQWMQISDLARKKEELSYQLSNLLISVQAGGAATPPSAVQYRELHTSMRLAYDSAFTKSLDDNDGALRALRRTFFAVDEGIRRRLSDVSLMFEDELPEAKYIGAADLREASCEISDDSAASLKGKGPGGAALGITSAFGSFWFPAAGDALSKPSNSLFSDFSGGGISVFRGLVCLSDDARWVFSWSSSLQPAMAQIVWSQQDKTWRGKVLALRVTNSNADVNRANGERAKTAFRYLLDKSIPMERKKVRYFSKDGLVGFSLPNSRKNDSHILIWSTSGLLDPDDSIQKDEGREWPPCNYESFEARPGSGAAVINECRLQVNIPGQVNIADGREQSLTISYGNDQPGCTSPKPGINCQSTIELRFQGVHQRAIETPYVSVRIPYNGARITNAKLQDGWLWLYDANNKTWRYIIERDRIEPLLELKWTGITWRESAGGDGIDDYQPSPECKGFPDCLKYLSKEGSWPGPPARPPAR